MNLTLFESPTLRIGFSGKLRRLHQRTLNQQLPSMVSLGALVNVSLKLTCFRQSLSLSLSIYLSIYPSLSTIQTLIRGDGPLILFRFHVYVLSLPNFNAQPFPVPVSWLSIILCPLSFSFSIKRRLDRSWVQNCVREGMYRQQ